MADVTDTYYAGEAFTGYGTQVLVGQDDASPETFVAIPDVNSVTFGDMTTAVIQKTHLRSPGRHHEKMATLRDSGPIVIQANYRPSHGAHKQAGGDGFDADHSVISLWRAVTENNFRIALPIEADGSLAESPEEAIILPFRGVITRYQIGQLGNEDKVPVTIEITPLQDFSGDLP